MKYAGEVSGWVNFPIWAMSFDSFTKLLLTITRVLLAFLTHRQIQQMLVLDATACGG